LADCLAFQIAHPRGGLGAGDHNPNVAEGPDSEILPMDAIIRADGGREVSVDDKPGPVSGRRPEQSSLNAVTTFQYGGQSLPACVVLVSGEGGENDQATMQAGDLGGSPADQAVGGGDVRTRVPNQAVTFYCRQGCIPTHRAVTPGRDAVGKRAAPGGEHHAFGGQGIGESAQS